MRHIVARGPLVNSREGTGTGGTVKTAGSQGTVGVGQRIGRIDRDREDLEEFLLTVETEGRLVIARAGNDTVLVEVGSGQEEVAVFRTAGNTQVVVPGTGCLEEVTDVVIIAAIVTLAPGIVGLVVLQGTDQFSAGIVGVFHVAALELILHGRERTGLREDVFRREVDLHHTVLTFLGGNQDHAVSSTGTVQGGCGRTFQDGHRFDILWVDIHHAVGRGRVGRAAAVEARVTDNLRRVVVDDAIDNEKRLVVAVFRTGSTTTENDGSTGTGSAGGLGHVDTRNLAGEGRNRVGRLVAHQFGCAEVFYGITQ